MVSRDGIRRSAFTLGQPALLSFAVWQHVLLQLGAAGAVLLPSVPGEGSAVQAAAEEPEEGDAPHVPRRSVQVYLSQVHTHPIVSTSAPSLVQLHQAKYSCTQLSTPAPRCQCSCT